MPPRRVCARWCGRSPGKRLAQVIELAQDHRVAGVLAQRLGADAQTWALLGADLRDWAKELLAASQLRTVIRRRVAAALLDTLGAADVPAAVVHGLAVESLYPEGAREVYGIEVLVSPDRAAAVRATLRALGYHSTGTATFTQHAEHASHPEPPVKEQPVLDPVRVTLVRRGYLDIATVGALLDHRRDQPVPGLVTPLTVLDPAAGLWLDLTRIAPHTPGMWPHRWHIHLDALTRLDQLGGAIPPLTLPGLVGPVAADRDALRALWPTRSSLEHRDRAPGLRLPQHR